MEEECGTLALCDICCSCVPLSWGLASDVLFVCCVLAEEEAPKPLFIVRLASWRELGDGTRRRRKKERKRGRGGSGEGRFGGGWWPREGEDLAAPRERSLVVAWT
uniref:Uncharacterized protein n=1 Tax=Oryza glumipatula TaxID=40148 RepID=A0A0E0AWN2_9ORYZ